MVWLDNLPERRAGGFDFDLCARNSLLEKGGMTAKTIKTGTVIVGVVYKDGVVLGADSRATSGSLIADKSCNKLHKVLPYIYCAGAGTAADLDQVGNMLSAQMKLLELNSDRKARVLACMRYARQYLFKYQGYIGAYLIIGGYDHYGPYLGNVHAAGSSSKDKFTADGSGSLAAMAVLERDYKEGMNEAEAIDLTTRALIAGMASDMACGNSLRYVVITKTGTRQESGIVPDFIKPQPREQQYEFPSGTSRVLKQTEKKFDLSKVEVTEVMETD